jgi:hypothetical protein
VTYPADKTVTVPSSSSSAASDNTSFVVPPTVKSPLELTVGMKLEVNYRSKGNFLIAKIKKVRDDGTIDVVYDDHGEIEIKVKPENIRELPTTSQIEIRRNSRFLVDNALQQAITQHLTSTSVSAAPSLEEEDNKNNSAALSPLHRRLLEEEKAEQQKQK